MNIKITLKQITVFVLIILGIWMMIFGIGSLINDKLSNYGFFPLLIAILGVILAIVCGVLVLVNILIVIGKIIDGDIEKEFNIKINTKRYKIRQLEKAYFKAIKEEDLERQEMILKRIKELSG